MKTQMLVEQAMTEKVIVANPMNSFGQVLDFFTRFGIQHLPVVENDEVKGILSIKDVLRFLHDELEKGEALNLNTLNEQFNITEVMTADPICISPEANLVEALEILGRGEFQALPVCENGIIRGIITNKDLVRVNAWEKQME